jgi:diguanylate cyclase (GGDEF)-like protein
MENNRVMLHQIAGVITANIDEITKRWVDELRRSERTEIHNQLLTSEIVNSTKGMLSNLAEAIAVGETPDQENPPVITMPRLYRTGSLAPKSSGRTAPLSGPLSRAEHAASSHGVVRNNQHFEIHEVVIEYAKLRQVIWDVVLENAQLETTTTSDATDLLKVMKYVDRMIDDLLVCTVEHFYSASVRDLEKRALRDPLTQLYNKEYFAQRLSEELRRAMRTGEPLTVAMIDMDHLKEINDTFGHPAGDSVIVAVATGIRDTCRRSDVPCRYGGDEFAVILPETGKLQAHAFAERIMRSLKNLTVVVPTKDASGDGAQTRAEDLRTAGRLDPSRLPLVTPVPSLSVGLATFPDDARNPETLLARSDDALYRAKREGRNRIVF